MVEKKNLSSQTLKSYQALKIGIQPQNSADYDCRQTSKKEIWNYLSKYVD